MPFRITIADSASTDGTLAQARAVARRFREVQAVHLDHAGRGVALRESWLRSDAKVVAYMDISLSTDLEALPELLGPLLAGHADVAVGTRLVPEAEVRRSLERELISRSYNILVRALLDVGFSDAQCGFKAARREVLEPLLGKVEDEGWFFDTELLYLAQRAKLSIREVPVRWTRGSRLARGDPAHRPGRSPRHPEAAAGGAGRPFGRNEPVGVVRRGHRTAPPLSLTYEAAAPAAPSPKEDEMAPETTVQLDRERVRGLIEREAARLDERTQESAKMYERARRSLSGGVASSYQARDPWPIYLTHGRGPGRPRRRRQPHVGLPQRLRLDGAGPRPPGDRPRDARPRRRRHPLRRDHRGRHHSWPRSSQRRWGLERWRFVNSGSEATMDAIRIARGLTGRERSSRSSAPTTATTTT